MSDTQTEVPADDPMRAAWERYKETDEYKNSRKWATELVRTNRDSVTFQARHVDGSMWAAFVEGWKACAQQEVEG